MKRGQEVLETAMLFEIAISVLVAGILFWALLNFSNLSFTNEKYISKDLQQITEFVKSMPGDVEINYPVLGIKYECDKLTKKCKLTEDESCELKIIKEGDEVSYEC